MATASLIYPIGQYQSWVPVWTGFSVDPSSTTARYTANGKMYTIWITNGVNGTSNAITVTVTLPVAAATSAVQLYQIRVTNNGTIQTLPGLLRTTAGSNIADIFLTLASGTFTNTGAKSIALAGLTYEGVV